MEIPEHLIHQIAKGQAVAFVGAGLSQGAGLPGWVQLLWQMLDWGEKNSITLNDRAELEDCINDGDLLTVAEEMRERFGRAAFHQFMVDKIRMPKPMPAPTHRLLPGIPFSAVLTTNYDKLIESVYEKTDEYASPHYFTHQEYPELSMAVRSGEFYILKVHGTIDRIETVILGKTDYRDIIYNNRPLHQYLLSLFSSKTLLFLGYSLNDPDLMLVLDELRATFKDYTVTHYALMNADEVSLLRQKRFRQDYGIQILPYSPSAPDHPEVGQFLEELAQAVKGSGKALKQEAGESQSPVEKFAEEIRIWLQVLRYEVSEVIQCNEQTLEMRATLNQGIIKQTVLVRCIGGEIRDDDVDALDKVLTRKIPQGWLISDKRISKPVRDRAAGDDAFQLFTLSEFLEKMVWKNYFKALTTLVEENKIHEQYVELACYRQDADEEGKEIAREKYKSLDKYIDSWLKELGKMHISLLGEFGTGKTWFCRHYAYRQSERYLQDPVNERLPLLITLRDFTKALTAQQLINDALLLQYKLPFIGNAFEVFMEMNRRGKVLLILDGFDEMSQKADYQTVVDNFWELAKLVDDNSKVLLASRAEYFRWGKETRKILGGEEYGKETIHLSPPKFEVLYIEPFNDSQIRQVIRGRLGTEKGKLFAERILENDSLAAIARKPLLIELLLAAMDDVDPGNLENQAHIYLYATNKLLLRNIDTQRTFTSTADKLYFLCELAWEMIFSQELQIHYKDIPQRIQGYFGEKIKDARELDHWDFDLRNQTLLHRNAAGYYEFAHKSLAEYFAAFKLAAELGCLAQIFAQTYCEEDGSICKIPIKVSDVETLAKTFGAMPLENGPLQAVQEMLKGMLAQDAEQRLVKIIQEVNGKTPEQVRYVKENTEIIMKKWLKISFTPNNFYISKIELRNIRCFENLSASLEEKELPILWTMVLGDNAAGKTTLLRCIALGLCNEGDAIALVKKTPGDFIRKGENKGWIRITLKREGYDNEYEIKTNFSRTSEHDPEVIRQSVIPEKDFPWKHIAVCGYGAQRSIEGSKSYDEYIPLNAVEPLFNYELRLQNPELVLLRRTPELRKKLEEKLLHILLLDAPEHKIVYSKEGMDISGSRGTSRLAALSDGYRSTVQWVVDFMGWLIYAERFFGHEETGSILLIDELEQHLHPKWQRHIVQRLRKQFPKTQVIATTHTPLTALGIVDIEPSVLLRLKEDENRAVVGQVVSKEMLKGKRADQVLASDAFGLVTTRSPGSEDDIVRYTELTGKTRNKDEDNEFQQLSAQLKETLIFGENQFEQFVEKAVSETLEKLLQKPPSELLNLETKRQLRELFRSE